MNTICFLVASLATSFFLEDYFNLHYLATEFMWNGFFINFRLGVYNLGWLVGFERVVFEVVTGFDPAEHQ
jgi:hypothetical protein